MSTADRLNHAARIVAFFTGTLIGGVSLGVGLRAIGNLARFGVIVDVALALTTCLGLICFISESFRRTVPCPTSRWLVPGSWSRMGEVPFSFVFGLILGQGWITKVNFLGYYVMAVTLLFIASRNDAVVTGLIYGGIRGLPVIVIPVLARQAASAGSQIGFLNERLTERVCAANWLRCGASLWITVDTLMILATRIG